MNEESPIGGLIIFVVFLLIHGILYGFGAAVQSVNDSSVEKKAEEGDRRSQKLLQIMEQTARFVNTLLGRRVCVPDAWQMVSGMVCTRKNMADLPL